MQLLPRCLVDGDWLMVDGQDSCRDDGKRPNNYQPPTINRLVTSTAFRHLQKEQGRMENGEWRSLSPEHAKRLLPSPFSIHHCPFSIPTPPDGETASRPAYIRKSRVRPLLGRPIASWHNQQCAGLWSWRSGCESRRGSQFWLRVDGGWLMARTTGRGSINHQLPTINRPRHST